MEIMIAFSGYTGLCSDCYLLVLFSIRCEAYGKADKHLSMLQIILRSVCGVDTLRLYITHIRKEGLKA